jgi:hypothetical protein
VCKINKHFLHSLLNVLVQIANKMRLQKERSQSNICAIFRACYSKIGISFHIRVFESHVTELYGLRVQGGEGMSVQLVKGVYRLVYLNSHCCVQAYRLDTLIHFFKLHHLCFSDFIF